MTSADMTLLSTDEVCRLLGIEERRLKQLIRDRVLIEARFASGERGVPRDIIVKGENGWEPLPFLQGTLTLLADDASRPRSPWPGCTPCRTSWVNAPSTRSPRVVTTASIASPRPWRSDALASRCLGAPGGEDITEFTQHGGCLVAED